MLYWTVFKEQKEASMAASAHLGTLTQRHQELEAEIASELKHPSHDEFRVVELKRQKLRIKDEIESIRIRNIAN